MKVDPAAASSLVRKIKKSTKKSSTAFISDIPEEEAVLESSSVFSLNAILELQSSDFLTTTAVKYGEESIKALESIRDSLVLGELKKDQLENLAKYTKKISTKDSRLQEILDEINCRLLVELAKYSSYK